MSSSNTRTMPSRTSSPSSGDTTAGRGGGDAGRVFLGFGSRPRNHSTTSAVGMSGIGSLMWAARRTV